MVKADSIDTVPIVSTEVTFAVTGAFWSVREDMPKVRFTVGTLDFCAPHAVTVVFNQFHGVFADRVSKAGPAGAGVKLGVAIK